MGRKFSEVDGKLYAVLNWDSRQDEEDVAVLRYLSEGEASSYRQHKGKGLSDTSIFELLFPKPERPQVELPRAEVRRRSRQFSEVDGKLYAVMNWDTRHSNDDVAVIKYLSPGEAALYHRHKKTGLSDTEVFRLMFPTRRLPEAGEMRVIQIDLSALTKRQLVRLIEAHLDMEMPSLERGSREDLEKLLYKLHRGS